MNQYLLSVHAAAGADCHSMPPGEMQKSFQRIEALEKDMKEGGAWMFSARLTEPESSTVVRATGGEILTTDGPFVESKEHLGGFYIIQAKDLDGALAWAAKVTKAIGQPIEVRPMWSPQGA